MLRLPVNNVLLTIETKLIAQVANALKMSAINPNVQIRPADYANVIGEVVSVPLETSDRLGYEGFSVADIQQGDMAIFRYDVVWNFVEHKEEGTASFKNMLFYKGKEYWKADIQQIFGVIRNNSIKMINGYVMVENIEKAPIILTPAESKKITVRSATLTQIGNNLSTEGRIDAFPGDRIFFNPRILQQYKIGKKEFGILRQKDVLGRFTGSYDDVTGLGVKIFDN